MISLRGPIRHIPQAGTTTTGNPSNKGLTISSKERAGFVDTERSSRSTGINIDGSDTTSAATITAARGEWVWSGIWVYGSLPSCDATIENDSTTQSKDSKGTTQHDHSNANIKTAVDEPVDTKEMDIHEGTFQEPEPKPEPQSQPQDAWQEDGNQESNVSPGLKETLANLLKKKKKKRKVNRFSSSSKRLLSLKKMAHSSQMTTRLIYPTNVGSDNVITEDPILGTSSSYIQNQAVWNQARPFVYKFQEIVHPSQVLIPSSMATHVSSMREDKESEDTKDEKHEQTEDKLVKDESNENQKDSSSIQNHHSTNRDHEHEQQIDHTDSTCHEEQDKNVQNQNPVIDLTDPTDKTAQDNNNILQPTTKESSSSDRGITFATMLPGETYTDAGLVHPRKCPFGGRWKGYFENVSTRKDRQTSHVSETFYLFFNATPLEGSRIEFPSEDENESSDINTIITSNRSAVEKTETEKDGTTLHVTNTEEEIAPAEQKADDGQEKHKVNAGILGPGLIHVRGTGSNQFGTFEILGSYNIDTGVLSCQRMYVSTLDDHLDATLTSNQESLKIQKKPGRKSKSTSLKNVEVDLSLTPSEKKTYDTRKRSVSFKRRYGTSESEGEGVGANKRNSMATGGGIVGRKRFRSVSESMDTQSNLCASPPMCDHTSRINVPSALKRSSSVGKYSDDLEQCMNINVMQREPSISAVGQLNSARSSPLLSETSMLIPSKKKMNAKSTFKGTGKNSSYQMPSATSHMVLPLAGDPMDARWRAAHFIYYQKFSDPAAVSDSMVSNVVAPVLGSAPVSSQSSVQFMIYEGEMNQGNNIRDGRGVCLYNNGTMYEGEWKNNKEHGRGKLMTSCRTRIFYEGDWERGKLNGRGTYYYYSNTPSSLDNLVNLVNEKDGMIEPRNIGIYEGDFRENSRHGTGKYTLPDGSSYDGEWRDNVPSGRGLFRWVDGSFYDGQWKDGKRQGQGVLKASDGFTYDGGWVNNAMEGRGVAIYPKGQRYEGSWMGGRREGRGTIIFTNGATYEGRFRDDSMEGQGTLKVGKNVTVPRLDCKANIDFNMLGEGANPRETMALEEDWMIPIEFQSDISHIHQKAGFSTGGN